MSDDGAVKCQYPKYQGQTLDQIASSEEGLLYLDWLVENMRQQRRRGEFYEALRRFLALPHIRRAVELAVENKPKRREPDPKPRPWWEK